MCDIFDYGSIIDLCTYVCTRKLGTKFCMVGMAIYFNLNLSIGNTLEFGH